MQRYDLFRLAMQAKNYDRLAWLIGAFSLTTEPDGEWKKEPYPYRIVSNPSGHYAVVNDVLTLIEDAPADTPIYRFTDLVNLVPSDIPNLGEPIESTYGNWFVNYRLLVCPFGTKIAYLDGNISPGRIEDIIAKSFKDNPKSPEDARQNEFYVDEYVKYVECIQFLTGLSQVSVWAATKKTLLPPPGIAELKAKLIEENKDTINELSTISRIDSELVKHDLAYLKGDPGMNFLMGGKAIDIVRKKKYLMGGAEQGMNENSVTATLIDHSLLEGWDINKFPTMMDGLRAGSFNRGAQTQLGGVSVKWLLRASSNMNTTIDDCASTTGSLFDVTQENHSRLVGFSLITDTGLVKIHDEASSGKYLGQCVSIRSPMYCHLDAGDFCVTCLGDRLSINKDGLSLAVAAYGSTMLYIYMLAAHGKSLSTAKMDFKKTIF